MGETEAKRQVFVLGAGASVDLKLPMGAELTGQISKALTFKTDDFDRTMGGDQVLLQALQGSRMECPEWYNAAKRISFAMPLAPSIDNFVDGHRNEKDIAYCAKAAITRCILKAERSSTLYVNPGNIYNTINFSDNIKAWHTLFFRTLTMYCTANQLGERLKQIAIVSFNYDRCLEHFLFHAIQAYYSISDQDTSDILRNLEIFHPYGKVGSLPFVGGGRAIRYGEEVSPRDLLDLSKQIRTFTESTVDDASETERMRQVLFETEFLVFLGFAFHPLNVKLLFPNVPPTTKHYKKRVIGTALGSSQSDLQIISDDLAYRYNCDGNNIELRKDLTCDRLFTKYSRTLSLT
jgi:hypothetical protein